MSSYLNSKPEADAVNQTRLALPKGYRQEQRAALLLRRVDVEDVLADCGKDFRVAAARRPLIQEHLGSHRKALAGDVLLTTRSDIEPPNGR
jgi:hypothetical protein